MAKRKYSKDDLVREIAMLDQVTNSLNTAVVALMYICKVKGTELDKVTSEKYTKYVVEHVHPLMVRADEIVRDAAEKSRKAAEESKKEIK